MTTGAVYHDLQKAINAASPGDSLSVSGRCKPRRLGTFDIWKDLSLIGQPGATLSGNGNAVMDIRQFVSATLDGLVIMGGTGTAWGAGIQNGGGSLTLRNSTVIGNTATWKGGGVYLSGQWANLTLSGTTNITSNTCVAAAPCGGGIFIADVDSSVTADGTWTGTVSDNTPDNCVNNGGTVIGFTCSP